MEWVTTRLSLQIDIKLRRTLHAILTLKRTFFPSTQLSQNRFTSQRKPKLIGKIVQKNVKFTVIKSSLERGEFQQSRDSIYCIMLNPLHIPHKICRCLVFQHSLVRHDVIIPPKEISFLRTFLWNMTSSHQESFFLFLRTFLWIMTSSHEKSFFSFSQNFPLEHDGISRDGQSGTGKKEGQTWKVRVL